MAMKIIDFETIRNLSISPADCVKWVETALRMKYDSCLPHKISMTIEPDVFFNTMPSYLPSCGRFGVKVVSRFPKREPALVSDILLYDATMVIFGTDGWKLDYCDAYWCCCGIVHTVFEDFFSSGICIYGTRQHCSGNTVVLDGCVRGAVEHSSFVL